MTKNANNGPIDNTGATDYTKKNLEDAALNFANFLYWLWIERRKREIMKMDKTIYDNEELSNVN